MTTIELNENSPSENSAQLSRRKGQLFRSILSKVAFWLAFSAVVVGAFSSGMWLRRWAWEVTDDIRFESDINNAFRQGTYALSTGYFNRYIQIDKQRSIDPSFDDHLYGLDYGPGRLLLATLWTRHSRTLLDGPQDDWQTANKPQYRFYERARDEKRAFELVRPMLEVNLAGEIISCLAMFFLVRKWTQFDRNHQRVPSWKPNVLGLISAIVLWFNMAVIINAHCWPQWDSWVLPFFLTAVLAASYDCWFIAGMCIATGAMFKGQTLFGAPLLIFWPVFRLHWRAVLRFVIGLFFAAAVLTSVWLVRDFDPSTSDPIGWTNKAAVSFVVRVMIGLVPIVIAMRWRFVWYISIPLVLAGMAIFFFPFAHEWVWLIGMIAAVGLSCAALYFGNRKSVGYTAAAWLAAALFLCVPFYTGSMGWFHCGIAYGSRGKAGMTHGRLDNLAGILERQTTSDGERWTELTPVYTMAPGKWADRIGTVFATFDHRYDHNEGGETEIPLKYATLLIFLTAVILSAFGAARNQQRQSARFLISIVAPWIVFFAVMPQMHQRYLLWGAAISASTVVISPGLFFLHLFLSFVSMSMEFVTMVGDNGGSFSAEHVPGWFISLGNTMNDFFIKWQPGVGYAVMLTAAIFLYFAVSTDRPRRKRLPKLSKAFSAQPTVSTRDVATLPVLPMTN